MADNRPKPRNDLDIPDAMHAMQSGVTYDYETRPDGPEDTKHFRVGINNALCSQAALAMLLVRKGIITAEEYEAALREEVNREVDSYEDLLTQRLGKKVVLR